MRPGNVRDRNAGFATGQAQVWGFDARTGIDSRSYGAPGAKIFYVDPNNAQAVDAGNLGEDPTVPLATVDAAVTLARAYHGDTIVVGANDAWQYAAGVRDTQIVESLIIPYTKGGIRIVGAATNPMACTWSPEADSEAAITVHAPDVLIEGFGFFSNDYTNCIGVLAEWGNPTTYGENLTVRGCYFEGNTLDYGIQLDYSWYNQIYNNYFEAISVAAIHSLDVEGDPDYCSIFSNTFIECTAAIDIEDVSHCAIHGNIVMGDANGTRNYIDLTGGSDNVVSDNWLGCTLAQYAAPNTCAGSVTDAWLNNHCIDGDTVANP